MAGGAGPPDAKNTHTNIFEKRNTHTHTLVFIHMYSSRYISRHFHIYKTCAKNVGEWRKTYLCLKRKIIKKTQIY